MNEDDNDDDDDKFYRDCIRRYFCLQTIKPMRCSLLAIKHLDCGHCRIAETNNSENTNRKQ